MIIALTGGIASGKSTVSQWFINKGIPVIDCDALVHSSYNEGGLMYQAVVDAFGPRIINGQGQIDRKQLGEIVFENPAALRQLSDLTHPIVSSMVDQRVKVLQEEGHRLIIVDIPLLYESGMQQHYDKVIVVYVPPELQLKRLIQRSGLDHDQAQKRIDSQMNLLEKAERADYIIHNEGGIEELHHRLESLLEALKSV